MIIWIIVAAMLLLASAFICFRLWFPEKNSEAAEQSGQQMNKMLYQEYIADLERQYSSTNTVTRANEKQALIIEAQRQLLADEQASGRDAEQGLALEKRGGAMLVTIALVLMFLALVLYARLGALPDVQILNLLENTDTATNTELREALTKRLEQRPDNFYYWLLLARVDLSEQRLTQAVQAYQRARLLAPENAAVAAELAQALFAAAGNRVDDGVEALVVEALKSDANNIIALELAGIVAFSRQDYASAITHWQRGLRFLHPDSPNAQALQSGIARAESLMNKEASIKGSSNTDAGRETENQASEAVVLRLHVRLAEELKESGQISPASTVYVYAREWQGPPMPLVAQRFTVRNLPIEVNFSDAMSLAPERQLSSVDQLEIIARVSLGGSLQASAGDLEGRLGPLSLGNDPAKPNTLASPGSSHTLIIDQRLP